MAWLLQLQKKSARDKKHDLITNDGRDEEKALDVIPLYFVQDYN